MFSTRHYPRPANYVYSSDVSSYTNTTTTWTTIASLSITQSARLTPIILTAVPVDSSANSGLTILENSSAGGELNGAFRIYRDNTSNIIGNWDLRIQTPVHATESGTFKNKVGAGMIYCINIPPSPVATHSYVLQGRVRVAGPTVVAEQIRLLALELFI